MCDSKLKKINGNHQIYSGYLWQLGSKHLLRMMSEFFKYHYEHMDLNVFDVLHSVEDIISIDIQIVFSLASGSPRSFWFLSSFYMTLIIFDNFLTF